MQTEGGKLILLFSELKAKIRFEKVFTIIKTKTNWNNNVFSQNYLK